MLSTIQQVKDLLAQGKTLILAAEEAALSALPRGQWIGGTIPYFMTADGGCTSRELVFVEEVPASALSCKVVVYDRESISRIGVDGPENGYTVLILPAFSKLHEEYALNAPGYEQLFLKVIAGWVAGVHTSDIGKLTPKVFDGVTGEVYESKAVALQVTLPATQRAHLEVVNIFEQGSGPEIRFESSGFEATDCIIDGQKRNFVAFFRDGRHDVKAPLVADFCGTLVNVSIQAMTGNTVQFYAPVFENVTYRLALPVANYPQRFLEAVPQAAAKPAFSCNCVLNYLYGDLEGRKTGGVVGPMTFGEIAHQLLNQTLVTVTVEAAD